MSALLAAAIIVSIAMIVRFYQKNTNAMCKSTKRLDGKTAIVTGGTTGMGLEIAKEFAKRGAKVIIACPFKDEGTKALKEILLRTGSEKVTFKLLDLGSLDSVRKYAAEILRTEDRLDILVNNAGVGVPKDFLTRDGMSFIMQVNYFGHFLLTLLLLPLMRKSGTYWQPSRIVNTSSVLHMIGGYGLRELNRTDHWFMMQIYGKSKISLVLFAHKLTQRLKGQHVVVNSVDPGAVGTRIFDSAGLFFGIILRFLFGSLFKTPWEGAQTALHVALDPSAGEVSGQFFKNCELSQAVSWAYNDKLAKRLWEESVHCVNLNDNELEQCLKS